MRFTCPRCETAVDDRYYGPCSPCRAQLRAVLGTEARVVDRASFEPALHVTPNAVAMKE